MFFAELGMMRGGEGNRGLWMVKGSNSRDFLHNRKSKSPSNKFEGDDDGEFKGVAYTIGSLPLKEGWWALSGVGDDEEIWMVWEPTIKFIGLGIGGGEGIGYSSNQKWIPPQESYRCGAIQNDAYLE